MNQFLPPYGCYNGPRARHLWLNAIVNAPATAPGSRLANLPQDFNYAPYQGPNSSGYCNSGYGSYYVGYQQQFKPTNPLYTSNFSPHQPWQARSSPSVPYAYQSSEFTMAFSKFSTTEAVPDRGVAVDFQSSNIGFLPSREMVRTDHYSGYNPLHLSFQPQQPCVNRVIHDSTAVNFLTKEAIPTAADRENPNHRSEFSSPFAVSATTLLF